MNTGAETNTKSIHGPPPLDRVKMLAERLEKNAAERLELIKQVHMVMEEATQTREMASELVARHGEANGSEGY
jgi:hypothetical protein